MPSQAEGSRRRALLAIGAALLLTACGGRVAETRSGADATTTQAAPETRHGGVHLQFKFQPGDLYYYVVENEIRSGDLIKAQGFALGVDSTISDRLTYNEKVVDADGARADLEWLVDRYYIQERTTYTKEVNFDSLRDQYPTTRLSSLGTNPGAKITFGLDGESGQTSKVQVTPGTTHRAPTFKKADKTMERCVISVETATTLLEDVFGLYLPRKPVAAGDEWSTTVVKQHPPYGELTTKITCSLRRIEESGDSRVGIIDIRGEVSLKTPPPVAASTQPSATTQAGPLAHSGATTKSATTTHPVTTNPAASADAIDRSAPNLVPCFISDAMGPDTQTDQRASDTGKKPTSASAAPTKTPPVSSRPAPGRQPPVPPRAVNPAATRPAGAAATTQPAVNRPVAPRPAPKPTEERVYKLASARLNGTARFDLSRCRLLELTVSRDLNFTTEMKNAGNANADTLVQQNLAHTLRVKGSSTQPPKPIIVGGLKPPPPDPNDTPPKPPPNRQVLATNQAAPAVRQPTTRPTTRPAVTSTPKPQPNAASTAAQATNRPSTQPSRPTNLPSSRPQLGPTRPAVPMD